MNRGSNFSGARKAAGRLVLDLERHVPYFFTVISSGLSRGASRIYRKHFKISITEWRIVAILAGTSDINANQICLNTGMDKAAVSRSLRILEKMKLVKLTQIENDNRSKTIALTPAGLNLHDRVIEIALEREQMLLSVLSADEREAFIRSLRKLRAAVIDVNKWDPKGAPRGSRAASSARSPRRANGATSTSNRAI